MFSDDKDVNYLQHCCLETLKQMAKVCEEHNITYYLVGGTLLGAVRHKGFIPWDDDIDIMMPRKDYDRFIEIANDYLPERYSVVYYKDFKSPEKPTMAFAQVIDRNTKLIREWAVKQKEVNVWIDIFPLDGMPKGKIRQLLHYYHQKLWHIILQISWFDEMVNLERPNRPFYESILIKLIKTTHLGHSWNTISIIDKKEKILKKYSFENSDTVGSLYGAYRRKEIIPRRWFENKVKLQFEDEMFWAPAEYHEELEHYYGDYMTPPKTRAEKEDHHKIKIIRVDESGTNEEKRGGV